VKRVRGCAWLLLAAAAIVRAQPGAALPNPVMFVTQLPIPSDFATIGSVFGNHRADTGFVGRGGDLYVRYPDGALRNLTAEAGFGVAGGFQGADSIAVRDPVVHWSGTRALFSMVIGAPTQRFQRIRQRWQLYEVSGLGRNDTAVITRVPQQPSDYNNIEPAYASNDDVIFSSDRPRDGSPHLYPQLDEYESRVITTGLWRLNPTTGELVLLQHAPSGSFTPIVDSFGRVVFTRWDHLQRDQQNDVANASTFNFSGEGPDSVATTRRDEVFPTPRQPPAGAPLNGHAFNQMFPWQIHQDGTEEETLAHLGRHELLRFFRRSFTDDPQLSDFSPQGRTNPNEVSFVLQMREDPTHPGRFLAIDAREFEDHASGQLIRFVAAPDSNAAQIVFEYLVSRKTWCCHDPVDPEHTGHYRNPLPMSDGTIIVAHTDYRGTAQNIGTPTEPRTPFDFRLKRLARSGTWYAPQEALTPGILKSVSYFDPDQLVSYSGPFWELSPVEVTARPVPPETGFLLRDAEHEAFVAEAVDPQAFRDFLAARGLGVLVMRDVTTRDAADRQQPTNLRVPGGVQTPAVPSGKVYDITDLQFFQGDLIRGGGGAAGRRVLAQPLHDARAVRYNRTPRPQAPAGSTPIFTDGSVAAYVPARRALAWQSVAPDGSPVVQERYWINVQPGEVRACDGCHGVNEVNQAGEPPAQNVALAFRALLARWREIDSHEVFRDGFSH
jgi:hypothetical protein